MERYSRVSASFKNTVGIFKNIDAINKNTDAIFKNPLDIFSFPFDVTMLWCRRENPIVQTWSFLEIGKKWRKNVKNVIFIINYVRMCVESRNFAAKLKVGIVLVVYGFT